MADRKRTPEQLEKKRERNRRYMRKWRLANPEKSCERERKWSANNLERKKATSNAWYAANCDKVRERTRARRLANPEKFSDYNRVYRATHLAQHRERNRPSAHRRRALISKDVIEPITAKQLAAILSDPCIYCGDPSEHIDHVIPLSRGGDHSLDNLVASCAKCNLSKGAKLPTEWYGRKVS